MPEIDEVSHVIGKLQSGMESIVKELHMINRNLTSALEKWATTEQSLGKLHIRVDDITDQYGPIQQIKKVAEEALEYGKDYHDNKKKVVFGAGLLVSLGVFLKWVLTW